MVVIPEASAEINKNVLQGLPGHPHGCRACPLDGSVSAPTRESWPQEVVPSTRFFQEDGEQGFRRISGIAKLPWPCLLTGYLTDPSCENQGRQRREARSNRERGVKMKEKLQARPQLQK